MGAVSESVLELLEPLIIDPNTPLCPRCGFPAADHPPSVHGPIEGFGVGGPG